jgi:uncharacterized protein YjbI with pentapeptide repeats
MTQNDLASRWKTTEGKLLATEVFSRLSAHKSLSDLKLEQFNGRLDLRGISTPAPVGLGPRETKGWVVEELVGLVKLERAQLVGLDFSGGRLESLRFFNTTIQNCRFDDVSCQDWRLWAVDVTDTSFVGADLRKSVLGAWYEGRGDIYKKVDFSRANMRSIICRAATFVDCNFGDAQLAKVDFQSSGFVRCRFAGLLREVIFYDHGFRTGKPDPNTMEDVDLSDAELRMVEFRRLNLDRVQFPKSADHLIVRRYRCVLERALRELQTDSRWSGLRAVFANRLKWAGPHQDAGAFNRRDLVEMGGEAEAVFAETLLRRLEGECSSR